MKSKPVPKRPKTNATPIPMKVRSTNVCERIISDDDEERRKLANAIISLTEMMSTLSSSISNINRRLDKLENDRETGRARAVDRGPTLIDSESEDRCAGGSDHDSDSTVTIPPLFHRGDVNPKGGVHHFTDKAMVF